jgi:hypothetical protein
MLWLKSFIPPSRINVRIITPTQLAHYYHYPTSSQAVKSESQAAQQRIRSIRQKGGKK